MGWDNNVGSSPERFGLKVVGIIYEPDMSYEFHELVVWQHEDGTLYWAEDSGCSCPSPFENYTKLDDLEVLDESNWKEFENTVKDFAGKGFASLEVDKVELLRDLRLRMRDMRAEYLMAVMDTFLDLRAEEGVQ